MRYFPTSFVLAFCCPTGSRKTSGMTYSNLDQQHMVAEFQTKETEATMATMTAAPFINHVSVMIGGVRQESVRHFYKNYFISCHPPDTVIIPVSHTIGHELWTN